jgi:hypothetical protein
MVKHAHFIEWVQSPAPKKAKKHAEFKRPSDPNGKRNKQKNRPKERVQVDQDSLA